MSFAQVSASVPGAKERDLKDAIRTLLQNVSHLSSNACPEETPSGLYSIGKLGERGYEIDLSETACHLQVEDWR